MAYAGIYGTLAVTDTDGTQFDLSTALTGITPTISHADADLTTFAAGGGLVTKTHREGILTFDLSVALLFSSAIWQLSQRLTGRTGGFAILGRFGSGAAPGLADEAYSGTFTLLNAAFVYNPGANATITWDLKPTDGAALPIFGTL